jgi:UBX domain-containing protein 1
VPEERPEVMDEEEEESAATPMTAAARKEPTSRPGYRNIATISSVRSAEPEGDDRGQAYYAGGSEHSGQQVLGPPRKNPMKDMISDVFKQAQAGNMETFDDDDDEDETPGHRFNSFAGTGYRLGETGNDTVEVQSSSSGAKKREERETVTVKVYRQGFTVDDGELRPYEDPRNREFFESITRNEIPAELRKQGKSMVHVNVENHLEEEFVKRAPRFKAFTGSGHTLGSPAPSTNDEVSTTTTAPAPASSATSNADNEAKATAELNVSQSDPTTMISVRLADGSRLSARFNLAHTVQDIRRYILTARPEYSGRNFMLLTTFPNKELSNDGDSIQQAGLQNAAILQRLK